MAVKGPEDVSLLESGLQPVADWEAHELLNQGGAWGGSFWQQDMEGWEGGWQGAKVVSTPGTAEMTAGRRKTWRENATLSSQFVIFPFVIYT